MRNGVLTVATAAMMLLSLAGTAQAQPPQPTTTTMPTYEFGLGYQWLRTGEFCAAFDASDCSDDDPQTFPAGIAFDAVRNWGRFGLLGDAGWSYNNKDFENNPFSDTLTTNIFHVGGGFRYTFHKGVFWPYAQAVGGVVVNHFDGQVAGADFNDTRTRPMIQAGGGATWVAGDGWGIFGHFDYRRLFLDEEEDFISGRNDIRFVVGVRMILD